MSFRLLPSKNSGLAVIRVSTNMVLSFLVLHPAALIRLLISCRYLCVGWIIWKLSLLLDMSMSGLLAYFSFVRSWCASNAPAGPALCLVNRKIACCAILLLSCGQLEAHFPGWTIQDTAHPGMSSEKPCYTRLFQALFVHVRPPFPLAFGLLPPVYLPCTVWAVPGPIGARHESLSALGATLYGVVLENLRFQRRIAWEHRPTEPLAAD